MSILEYNKLHTHWQCVVFQLGVEWVNTIDDEKPRLFDGKLPSYRNAWFKIGFLFWTWSFCLRISPVKWV